MRGVKGCFVCGEQDRSRERHTREQVDDEIRILKDKSTRELITVEDLDAI